MQLGMIGLGRMGGNMATRLVAGRARREDVRPGRRVDRGDARRAARPARRAARVLADGAGGRRSPRATFQELLDARRGRRHDRRRRQLELPRLAAPLRRGRPSTASTSSTRACRAASGACEVGYCLMVGGDAEAVSRLEPIFTALAPADGYAHVGACRRRALHEDGPQRDRVRPDAGLRRGLRGAAEVRVRPRPARDRRHLALRLGRPLVAARAAPRRVRAARAASSSGSRAGSRTPARAAGRSPRRSPRTCRCR